MDDPISQDANGSERSGTPLPSAHANHPRDLIPTPVFCAGSDGRLLRLWPMESQVAWVDQDPASWPEAPPAPTLAPLAASLLTRTQQPLARLRFAFEAGDARLVEVQARVLKGLCSTVGAGDAARRFDRILSVAQSRKLEGLDQDIEGAAAEVRVVVDKAESRTRAA